MKLPLVLAVVAVPLAVVLVWLLGPGDEGAGARPEDGGTPTSGGAGDADLDAPGGPGGVTGPAGPTGRSIVDVTAPTGPQAAEAPPCSVHGEVVDQDGNPVPGLVLLVDRAPPDPLRVGEADLWLTSKGHAVRGPHNRLHEWGRHQATGTTDAQGRFEIPLPSPLRWRLTTWSGAQPNDEPAVAATGVDMTIEAGERRYVRLMVHLERYVRGRVVTPDGDPAYGALVWTERRETETVADNDGYFEIGPMIPGRWRLVGVWNREGHRTLAGGPVECTTDDQDVRIVLRIPRMLYGLVLDADGAPTLAVVHARCDETGEGLTHNSDEAGEFILEDLTESRWSFVARDTEGNWGRAFHDVPGGEGDLGSVVIQTRDGAAVQITNASDEMLMRYVVTVDGMGVETGRLQRSQTVTVEIPTGGAQLDLEGLATNVQEGGMSETGWNETHQLDAQPGETLTVIADPE